MTPRRQFLQVSATLATGLVAHALVGQETKAPPPPPALPPDKVRDTVSFAHRDLEKLRALLDENPLLANACWDWGGGDFETPLEAAAHTGRREIAEFLLAKNARASLYAAAMLGQLDVLKAALAPDIIAASAVPGPHGFTLLHCAKQGGESSKSVYDWLIAQGVPEVFRRPLAFKSTADADGRPP